MQTYSRNLDRSHVMVQIGFWLATFKHHSHESASNKLMRLCLYLLEFQARHCLFWLTALDLRGPCHTGACTWKVPITCSYNLTRGHTWLRLRVSQPFNTVISPAKRCFHSQVDPYRSFLWIVCTISKSRLLQVIFRSFMTFEAHYGQAADILLWIYKFRERV